MKERKEKPTREELPKGRMVFDAGVVIELLLSASKAEMIKKAIRDGEILPYVTHITFAEVLYILCRRIGWRLADEKVMGLIESGYFIIEEVGRIFEISARYKCERRISLADCFTLSLAKYVSAPALFAVREKELVDENEKNPFDVSIIFLEDFL